jgi:hypoxanthine phosphoribosyltransferase
MSIHNDIERVFYSNEEIQAKVKELGEAITRDYQGKNPIFIGVLKGCFVFMADLMRNVDLPCEIEFMAVSSYGKGTTTSGAVQINMDLKRDIEGRDVIIVEDIVDTGLTMHKMLEVLGNSKPASLAIASLFLKPARLRVPVEVKYSAFEIPDRFIVGYGLDYDGLGRNLPDVYDVKE